MTENRRKRTTAINTDKIYIWGMYFVIGAFIGSFIAFFAKDNFLYSNNLYFTDGYDIIDFFKLCFKYFKFPIAIWVSAFVNAGIFTIPFLLIVKGAGLGFTGVIIGTNLGLSGVLYSVCILFLNNFIFIFTYIYLAEVSFRFLKNRSFKLKDYTVSFGFSCIFILIAILSEIFINPIIIGVLGGF